MTQIETLQQDPAEPIQLSHHLFDTMTVKLTHIQVLPGRGRKSFKNIPELAESIKQNGLIQPLVLRETPEVHKDGGAIFNLMAGERRYRALMFAGFTEAPCRAYMGDFADDHRATVIELEENVNRDDLDWPEEQALLARIDEEYRKIHGEGRGQRDGSGWTTEKTAEHVGKSPQSVGEKINFHKKMSKRPDIAKQVLGLPQKAAMKEFDRIVKGEDTKRAVKEGVIKITGEILRGSCLDLFQEVEDQSVDLILTDPPFGLDELAEARGSRGEVQAYIDTLRPTDNMNWGDATSLITKLPEHFDRVLKPGSHFYIFCKAQLFNFIYELFNNSGNGHLAAFHTPIIWDKGRTTAPFRGYNYCASYEMILYGWKKDPGEADKPKRLSSACRDILTHKPVPVGSKVHPFEKPQDLLQYLIKQSTHQGDFVVDPFCGSAATVRAAFLLKRRGLTFEIDEGHYNRALKVMEDERAEATPDGASKDTGS